MRQQGIDKKKTPWELNNVMINIRKDTKGRLQRLGHMGDSFQLVVDDLVYMAEKNPDIWSKAREENPHIR